MTTSGSNAGPFAAQLLRSGSAAHAARAVEELLERHPEIGDLFGDHAFRRWQDNTAQRLQELAASVEMGEPEMFVTEIGWSRDAFEARGVPVDALRRSLEILALTLEESLPESAFAAVEPCLNRGIEACVASEKKERRIPADGTLGVLMLEYLEQAMRGDRVAAVTTIVQAFEKGTPVEDLYERVLLASEAEIGTMWHLGEVSISEEHMVTETARAVMGVLCYLSTGKKIPPEDRPTVTVAAVEGDRHDLGVRAVSDLFEIAGFRSVCLGASSPASDIAQAVEDYGARYVVLSAAMSVHVPSVTTTIRAIRERTPKARILVGGEAFRSSDQLPELVGADGFASSPREAVRLAKEWESA